MSAYIDVHVHPPVAALLEGPLAPFIAGLEAAIGRSVEAVEGDEIIEQYRARNARAMFVGWDLETSGNRRPFSSVDVAALVAQAPDVVAGWGAVDAAKGALAVSQVHEAARLGMKGIAVHPAAQGMGLGDRLSSPVWEAAAEYGLVCLVHTGTTRLGYATAGGAGVKLSAGNPLHVDSVAAKLPHLRLVLAHTGPLWAEEAIAVASHKANVYLCPTGAAPQSWPGLADAAATTLRDRIVFGSGYPLGDPDALVELWRQSDMSETTLQQVLVDNSVALFDW